MGTNGECYKGKWKNNEKHGIGQVEKDNIITKGRWENGEMVEVF